jgi:hypothetical protein
LQIAAGSNLQLAGVQDGSAFDQTYIAGARTFLRVFRSELHPLAFTQQLEHRASDRAPMEKVLDSTLVADEPKPFVNEEACNCPGWHTNLR